MMHRSNLALDIKLHPHNLYKQ